MTVIARFEVIPVRDGSMSTAIAHALRALDRYPVSYETTATDTIIEAETVDQVFEAVRAAHQAIPDDRVITSVEVDEDRRRPQTMHERVASVEQQLGHPAQRSQEPAPQARQGQPAGAPTQTPSSGGQLQTPPTQTPPADAPGGQTPPPENQTRGRTPPAGGTGQPAPGPEPPAPGQPR